MDTKDNATQQGADDNEDVVESTPLLNPRVAAMDAIADKVDDAILEELGIKEDEEKAEEVEEKPVEKKPDQVERQTRKVKIDGEEMEVDDEELIRGYQKNQTASRRLEEAAKRAKELDGREAVIRAEETRIAGIEQQIKKTVAHVEEDDSDSGAELKSAINAIYEGDTASAEKLFGKLLQGGRAPATPPAVDLDAIADRAAAKATERITTQRAMEKFQQDYQDIVGNTHLAKVADSFLEEEVRNKPFAEALEEAGKRTREWLAEITPKPANTPTARGNALANKEKVDNLPSQSSVSGAANDEPDESVGDIIRNMRKARGLAV